MKVRDYLAGTDRTVISCRFEDTVQAASALLATHQIGALPVRDVSGLIAGILSERDIVHSFAQDGAKTHRLLVGDIMVRRPPVCGPDDSLATARQKMKTGRIRHLMVMDGDRLFGLLSISDVLEVALSECGMEVNVLRDHTIALRG